MRRLLWPILVTLVLALAISYLIWGNLLAFVPAPTTFTPPTQRQRQFGYALSAAQNRILDRVIPDDFKTDGTVADVVEALNARMQPSLFADPVSKSIPV